ncbi:beta-ketoacyl synthase [Maribacter sp.]|uniref:beta-ketoacyl-[acyl-carrier-protein] synthase family protein n=1 Tax=Maribacter sp. TaxID=1897614 RepID=UPI0025BE0B2B|nr:beta-ketoacyl synthase [Maribacter sp.]
MSRIYLSHNNIISSYGFNSSSAVEKIKNEISSLKLVEEENLMPKPFYSSMVDKRDLVEEFKSLKTKKEFTALEQMMILSLSKVIVASNSVITNRSGLIVSTTKGNIDALELDSPFKEEKAYLSELGKAIKNFFGFSMEPLVLSNACVSGVLATSVAKRLINQDLFDDVFIVSGDLVTKFILSGFNSFQAMSTEPCKPFSKSRTGINIGEVIASILVTKASANLAEEAVEILGDGTANDANHISGPSRTGEGLVRSVNSALKEADILPSDIDYISAHGTATIFNDEMEAIAFNRLKMSKIPLNSLKGYFGHTLGASGLLETIVGMHSVHQNMLFASLGFDEIGVSKPLNIIKKATKKNLNIFLKTASGFGGCNTAAIFKKV